MGDIYVTASNETANVEREFSKQNLTMTNLRNALKIANMSHKVCNKEYSALLGAEVTESILIDAAIKFKAAKVRKVLMK